MSTPQVTYHLPGKRALVTGAGRGTGRAIALALARAGVQVYATGRNAAALTALADAASGLPGSIDAIPGDLATRAGARAIAARCEDLDILVNNAALTNAPRESLLDQADETWDAEFAINVVAPVTLMQALVPGMIRRGGGSVINISSIAARRPNPLHTAYAASKGALEIVTYASAVDFARHNVRVNAIQLGLTDTEALHEQLPPGFTPQAAGRIFTPMGRVGGADEVAAMCLLLASDAAAAATGTVITMDCGSTAGTFETRTRDEGMI
ncbi:MAG: SDR family oxidoreductase [Sphingomonadales bacterium]|nr:SDR family oxidoreductase [Sphingomonadales bacterium]